MYGRAQDFKKRKHVTSCTNVQLKIFVEATCFVVLCEKGHLIFCYVFLFSSV